MASLSTGDRKQQLVDVAPKFAASRRNERHLDHRAERLAARGEKLSCQTWIAEPLLLAALL